MGVLLKNCTRWAAGLLLAGLWSCAPVKWDAVVGEPAKLSWPPRPNPKKVEYIGSLRQFTPVGSSLRTVIFGRGEAGEIVKPMAIAVGGDGRMAIVDAGKRGVHLFIPAQQQYILLTKAGDAEFQSPVSVIFDESLNLVVSDSQLAKVFLFDVGGRSIRELKPSAKDAFVRPTGLAYQDVDKLYYVVDSKSHQVSMFNDRGDYLKRFGGLGIANGKFNIPTHIATGMDGKLYVVDAMNFRLQTFSPQGEFSAMFGHHGDGSGDFAMPKGIAVDRFGVIYVAETLFDTVQMFSANGDYLLSLGTQGDDPGEFWMPSGLFIDRADKLYVCDTYNKRIQIFQLYGQNGGDSP